MFSLERSFRLMKLARRFMSCQNIEACKTEYQLSKQLKQKPKATETCKFGEQFTDHMLTISWDHSFGWHRPMIKPLENISLHPSACVFHYAIELFEGMKAYRTNDNRILMFRPMENMKRMEGAAIRSCLPKFDKKELLKCIADLVRIDKDWVPRGIATSLYIRPTIIGTEAKLGVDITNSALFFCILSPVGQYFPKSETLTPISLLADPQYVRVPEGGVGSFKLGSNYGPCIMAQEKAKEQNCDQVLWLYGCDQLLTEVGTMNLFVYWINEDGDEELSTMPLDMKLVLPGITRMSLMEIAKSWNEFKVVERNISMDDIMRALDEGRLLEMFGSGTACVVSPIDRIHFNNLNLIIPFKDECNSVSHRLYNALTDIQYGRVPHEWTYEVAGKD